MPGLYHPYSVLVKGSLMENCREAGIEVVPWTVDEEDHIQKMLDMQVDGIISN